jgi:hypothetical protein
VGKKEVRFEAIFIPFYQVGIFWTMWKFWSFHGRIVNLTRMITQVIQMVQRILFGVLIIAHHCAFKSLAHFETYIPMIYGEDLSSQYDK